MGGAFAAALRVRHRVLKTGLIEFSGGGAIRCAIKNLSASGAALQFESALDIPDRLTLSILPEPVKRQCRVIWRGQKRVGVTFEQAASFGVPFRHIQRLKCAVR
jgi:hypothetical protein